MEQVQIEHIVRQAVAEIAQNGAKVVIVVSKKCFSPTSCDIRRQLSEEFGEYITDWVERPHTAEEEEKGGFFFEGIRFEVSGQRAIFLVKDHAAPPEVLVKWLAFIDVPLLQNRKPFRKCVIPDGTAVIVGDGEEDFLPIQQRFERGSRVLGFVGQRGFHRIERSVTIASADAKIMDPAPFVPWWRVAAEPPSNGWDPVEIFWGEGATLEDAIADWHIKTASRCPVQGDKTAEND